MIQLSSLTKSFGERVLLDDVTWPVSDGERVGLCGPNGAGKTTLLRMLAGLDEPDRGAVVTPGGLTVGYLPQDGLEHSGRSLVDEASLGLSAAARGARRDRPHRARARRSGAARRRARSAARPLPRPHRVLPARGGPQHRPARDAGARGPRLLASRLRQAGRDVLGRLADAHRAGQAAARPADAAAARRADEPSRSRRAQLARGVS